MDTAAQLHLHLAYAPTTERHEIFVVCSRDNGGPWLKCKHNEVQSRGKTLYV